MLFINAMWILVCFSYIHNIRMLLPKTPGCFNAQHPDVFYNNIRVLWFLYR